MDDMGLIYFTKYALRIQRVIMKLFSDNPARMLTGMAVIEAAGIDNTILQSSWIQDVGGLPFEEGAFKLPEAIMDSAVINASTSLLR